MVQVPSPVVAAEQTCRVTIFSETQQNEVKFAYALRFGVGARAQDRVLALDTIHVNAMLPC